MTGVFVAPGFLAVRFREAEKLRELIVPMDGAQFIELAGMLLEVAGRMQSQGPQVQPAKKAEDAPAATRVN